ncbi:MAG: MogA/MoaB family molybdenum cofactor biosynthesis protein [Synergistetes bacterium]|nr:MogA/MoaB family molybdenum cofactor biosynthesis protein [Synergistota bacterium]
MRPISVGVIVASDKGSKGEREDISGRVIEEKIIEIGGEVKHYFIVPDEIDVISKKIKELASLGCDLVLTSGGTGWSKRDVTPEATIRVIEKEIPGLAEIMRIEGYKRTPFSVLSRAVAGIVGETVVINLPGSPKGVRESLELLMPVLLHGIGVLKGWDRECGKIK